jgi:excisionase family DNA binding protein
MALPAKSEISRRTRTIPEAGKILGISRNSAYEAARTGEIQTIRLGKRLLVPNAALEALLGEPLPPSVSGCRSSSDHGEES